MMPEQGDLLLRARESLAAAKLLHEEGYHGFAASRAYYAMFYVAKEFLKSKDMAFLNHSGAISAFSENFGKPG